MSDLRDTLLVITDQFGKKVEVYHGANCVGLHGTVVLTPDQARRLADMLYHQAGAAEQKSVGEPGW